MKSLIDGLIAIDENNKISSMNPCALDIFGYSPHEIIGEEIASIFHKSSLEVVDDTITEYRNTGIWKGHKKERKVVGITKDKSEFPFLLSLIDGLGYGLFLIVRRNTFWPDAIASLKESESRLNAIFEAAVDGIITTSDKGIVESLNPAAANLFGYSSEEVIGNNISMLMPEPHRGKHDGYMDNYERTGQRKIIGIGRDLEGLKKNGERFPFRLAISELWIKGRRIYTGIIHDNSAQKASEDKLRKLNEELEDKINQRTAEIEETMIQLQEINKNLAVEGLKREKAEAKAKSALAIEMELGELKSRFVSMASHEFRTPLSGILSSISLIDRYNTTEENDKRKKHVQRIKSSVKNLTTILDDFLSLDKLAVGKVECQFHEFNISNTAKYAIELIQQGLKTKQNIDYQHHGEDHMVYLDEHLMSNVFNNLLSNAIKYSEESQSVLFETTLEGNQLIIKVQDHGIGIPEDEKERMFERFFRARNVTNIQGTGLGMTIVKHYLDLMGGTINFESEEGVGTTFTIVLPRIVLKQL